MNEHPAEFKVMWPYKREDILEYKRLECPQLVPWDFVLPHDAQARKNHGHWQGVKRLNERGGLAPCELVAVLQGRAWRRMPWTEAVAELKALLNEYLAAKVKKFGWMLNDPDGDDYLVIGSFATYAEALADAYKSMRSAGCNSTTILIGEMFRPDFLSYIPWADHMVESASEQFTGDYGSCDDYIFELVGDQNEATDELRDALKDWAEKWVENNVKWWLAERDCEELHIRADDETPEAGS